MAEEEKKEEEKKEESKKEEPKKEEKKQSAPSGKYKDLIKQIESLSVVELSELVKELEERFGVSGAPVAAVSPATATVPSGQPGQPQAGEPEQGTGEKTKFEVVLSSAGSNKIAAIKAVREIKPDLGLKEAKDLVEAAPKTLLTDASKEDAEKAKKKLEDAGATAELK